MRQKLKMALLAPLLAVFLSNCAQPTPVVVVPPKIKAPHDLFVCEDAPLASGITDQKALGRFIAELDYAHKDCKAKLMNLEGYVNAPDPQ